MSAEQRPTSEATVRLPKMSAEATVQIAAPKADVAPPPLPQPETSTPVRLPLSPQEKAQRRLIKNLVMGGFFVVVLVVVFYFLSQS
jgi:hypothetical protein